MEPPSLLTDHGLPEDYDPQFYFPVVFVHWAILRN